MSALPVLVSARSIARATPADAFEMTRVVDPTTTFTGWGPLPSVISVRELFGGWAGVGGLRELTFSDATTVREELVVFEPGSTYAYNITGFRNVLRHLLTGMRSEWRFTEHAHGATQVELEFALLPLPGRAVVVRAIFAPSWRRYLRRILNRTIAQIDEQASGGVPL